MTIRIALALLTIIIGCVFIMRLFVWHSVDLLFQARKQEVQHIVQVAWKSLTPILEKQRAGILSPEDALEEATAMLRGMTYVDEKGDNYIFMSRYDRTMLVQPFEPRLQGTNQWDLTPNKQIPSEFEISEKTVKIHPARVFAKMLATSLPELVRMADHLSPSFEPK